MRTKSQYKSQKREDKKRNKRGMRVGSRSVFTILKTIKNRVEYPNEPS